MPGPDFAKIDNVSGWVEYEDHNTGYNTDRGWELCIAIHPEQSNLNKAVNATANLFDQHKLSFRYFVLNLPGYSTLASLGQDVINTSIYDGSDKDNVRGQEITVALRQIADSDSAPYELTATQIKILMLTVWKQLQDAGVEIGYMVPWGYQAIDCEEGLITPFAVAAFKEDLDRHGELHQAAYNPANYPNPFADIKITKADLAAYGIKLTSIAAIHQARVTYLDQHFADSKRQLATDFQKITQSSRIVEPDEFENYVRELKTILPTLRKTLLDTQQVELDSQTITQQLIDVNKILAQLKNITPRNPDANLSSMLTSELKTLIEFKTLIEYHITEPDNTVRFCYVNSLTTFITKLEDLQTTEVREQEIQATIADWQAQAEYCSANNMVFPQSIEAAVKANPAAMQLLYRRMIHLQHEEQQLAQEQQRVVWQPNVNNNFIIELLKNENFKLNQQYLTTELHDSGLDISAQRTLLYNAFRDIYPGNVFDKVFYSSSTQLENIKILKAVLTSLYSPLHPEQATSDALMTFNSEPNPNRVIINTAFNKNTVSNRLNQSGLTLAEKLQALEKAFQAIKTTASKQSPVVTHSFFKPHNAQYTDQQLVNIQILKELYVTTLKNELKNNNSFEAVLRSTTQSHDLIKFNRTRYAVLTREQTSTQKAVEKLLNTSDKRLAANQRNMAI